MRKKRRRQSHLLMEDDKVFLTCVTRRFMDEHKHVHGVEDLHLQAERVLRYLEGSESVRLYSWLHRTPPWKAERR